MTRLYTYAMSGLVPRSPRLWGPATRSVTSDIQVAGKYAVAVELVVLPGLTRIRNALGA